MNALDVNNASSCWNSDGQADGEIENYFVIHFHRNVCIKEIKIQFQGGFAAEECTLYVTSSSAGSNATKDYEWIELEDADIEPENINLTQKFSLDDIDDQEKICNSLKLGLESFSDFYGRVIIYKLEVWGEEC